MNEYRIFEKSYVAHRRAVDWNTAVCGETIATAAFTETVANYPCRMYLSALVWQVIGKQVGADCPKTVEVPLSEDLTKDADTLSLSFNAATPLNRLTVEVAGTTGTKRTTVSVWPQRWNTVLLDWARLGDVGVPRTLRLGVYCAQATEESEDVFQWGDSFFGTLCDLTFARGDAMRFLSADGMLTRIPHGVRWQFAKGDALRFPAWRDAQYSVTHFTFGVQDSILLGFDPREEDLSLVFRFVTDVGTAREVPFTVARGTRSVLVSMDGLCADGEKLLQTEIAATCGGTLVLRGVRYMQEKSGLGDSEPIRFGRTEKERAPNRYAFTVRDARVCVDGSKTPADGWGDDTPAINAAVEALAAQGGGRVELCEPRYVATHIVLRSGVELHIADGTVLMQSDNPAHYPYDVAVGHDSPTASCPWPHNFLVHNRPLIYAENATHIKVTGGGKIRMCDAGCHDRVVGFPYWPIHCEGTIHIVPIGFHRCEYTEISGITVERASSYHIFLCGVRYGCIRSVRLLDPRCLSADGIGLACTKDLLIDDAVIVTNDDGVTLIPMYDDPRGGGWWKCTPGKDNSVRNIEIARSYIDSGYGGGGKAVAFIPWGSDAPQQELQQIDGIYVHDCILHGGHAVGTWCDNPYHGKQPFDNSETDDYSPVKNIRIVRNDYRSPVDLMTVKVTDMVSDAGLYSAGEIVNGDFSAGLSNWNGSGNVRVRAGVCELRAGGGISQGLHFAPARYTVTAKVRGKGTLRVGDCAAPFACGENTEIVLPFCAREATDVQVKIEASDDCFVFWVSSQS